MFGLIAWIIVTHAEGVYNLVLDAASFGTAGIFTVLVFGLFTKIGGRFSVAATMFVAIGVWLSATYFFDIFWAYLLSLICAITAYVVTAAIGAMIRK